MAALIVVGVLILADLLTKRRNSPRITRCLCVLTPASLLACPLALWLSPVPEPAQAGVSAAPVLAWLAAVLYLSLRTMTSRYAFFTGPGGALSMTGSVILYSAVMLVAIPTGFFLLLYALLQMFAAPVEAFLTSPVWTLIIVLFITIILAPFGLMVLILHVGFFLLELIPSVVVFVAVFGAAFTATAFVAAVPVVMGIRAVRMAIKQDGFSLKNKLLYLFGMCLPIANIIPALFLRRRLKRGPA